MKLILQRHILISFTLAVLPTLLWAQTRVYFDPLRFETAIAAFEASDKVSPPPPGGILFTGSSSIRFWHDRLLRDMQGLTVIPRGYGGSTMQDAVYYIDRVVIPYQPRAIVLYEGDNDIGAYDIPATQVRDLFQLFVSSVHRRLPQTRIYMLAIKPSILRQKYWPQMQSANSLLKAVCDSDNRLYFIDVANPLLLPNGSPNPELFREDNLHLNSKGYDLWASILKPALKEHESKFE